MIINGKRLNRKNIQQKGKVRFTIDIPDKYRDEDMLIVMLKPNKTFVPVKRRINDDRRRLSFILEKIELW